MLKTRNKAVSSQPSAFSKYCVGPGLCRGQAARSSADYSATDGHGLTRIKMIRENSRESVAGFLGKEGGFKLQFKVKGKDYFLAFVEDERRWYVFAPTAQGVH